MRRSITDREQAGAVEPFRDAALYDWEYRKRRNDIAFYRMLAEERMERMGRMKRMGRMAPATPPGPVLDLGCGTGRLMVPLARDGHRVVGVDLSAAMLTRAAAHLRRAPGAVARRCLLMRGDLRALPLVGKFPLAFAAFHTVQHLVDDRDLVGFFRSVRRLIAPDGWFAFDIFSPDPRWLARPSSREFDRTVFRHPTTGHRLAYTVSHRLDGERRALHMVLRYRPVDEPGAIRGRSRVVRLCHRQLPPRDVQALLRRSGLEIIGRWGGFDGEPLADDSQTEIGGASDDQRTEQHVYLTRPAPRRPSTPRKPQREPG